MRTERGVRAALFGLLWKRLVEYVPMDELDDVAHYIADEIVDKGLACTPGDRLEGWANPDAARPLEAGWEFTEAEEGEDDLVALENIGYVRATLILHPTKESDE